MAKVMISLPDALLAEVDRAARDANLTRSAFVQGAVRRELGGVDLERRRAALAALHARFADVSLDAEEAVRVERDR